MTASTPFRPKRAIMLAAGLGKRMRPLTATTPKPLIEVAGRSLMDYGLDKAAELGIREVVVNVHYLADLVEVHALKRTNPKIIISDERAELLDTGGGIKKVIDVFQGEPFLVLNSDSTWIEGARKNLDRLCDAWDPTRMDALMLIASTVSCTGYDGQGDFEMDQHGVLTRRVSPRIAPFVYAGALILKPDLLADTPDGPFSLNTVFDRAILARRLVGMRLDGYWLHVGTPKAIGDAEDALQRSLL